MADTQPPPPVIYARGISIFNSRTFYFNMLALGIAVLVLPQVGDLVPEKYVRYYEAAVAIGNVIMRLITVRPASITTPGTVNVVEIKKIDPPAPPKVGD
jgi:hypothetical protein